MKKLIVLFLGMMILGLAGCGGDSDPESSSKATANKSSVSAAQSEEETESTNGTQSGEENVSSGTGSQASGANSSTPNNASAQSKSSGATTSTAPKPNVTGSVPLANQVNIKTGTKPMEEGLNFGGKTFTMAITQEPQYHTDSWKRMISAFETTYNCKIKASTLTFDTYNQQLRQEISSKKPFDIAFMHGSQFPDAPKSNIYQDLSNYFTTADYSSSDKTGIDIAKSSYFVWDKKLYGVCEPYSVYPYVIYYNKAMFKSKGLEDPLELYNAGKWSWSKIIQMGKKVTDTGKKIYFLSNEFKAWGTLHAFGTSLMNIKDGKVIENYSSAGITDGLTLIKTLMVGANAISQPETYNGEKYISFWGGSAFMTMEESAKYPQIADGAKSSIALQRTKNNIGIVPVPLDKTNKEKSYPTGWLTAVGSCEGSTEPRAAVAFAKFKGAYNDPVRGANEMSAAETELANKLLSGNICFLHGAYATSSDSTIKLAQELVVNVLRGMDVPKSISEIRPKVLAAIKATTGQ